MAFATIFLILFLLFSIIHVIGEFLAEKPKMKIRTFTKPFLLPFLICYYVIFCIETAINIEILIMVGLILGFVGDVVLLKPKVQILFMIGLGSFLIGHVLYIIAFFQASNFLSGISPLVYMGIIGYVLFFLLVFRFLKDSLKEMTIPVSVYMTLILVMSFATLALMFSPTTGTVKTPWLLFVGSLNFIMSDFLLANQLFKKAFKYDQAIIMLTYLIAQFCIAQAYL
jgi:uncharacterized membrane protein YhhN